jgi:VWFA-related protein
MLIPRIGIWLAALTIGAFTIAQEKPTFKVNVDVVNVLATVRDRGGRIINDLTRDDFTLEENGKKQEIAYFSRQTDLPLTLGLLVDTSGSQTTLLDEERKASDLFFHQIMRPDRDRAFVIKFDSAVEMLQKPTQSLESLQKTLNGLKLSSRTPRPANPGGRGLMQSNFLSQGRTRGGSMMGGQRFPGGSQRGGQSMGRAGSGTRLYDAIFLACDEVLQKLEGRKAIIIISDGVDTASKYSEEEAIEAAHRADTIIYAIRYYETRMQGGGGIFNAQSPDGKTALKALSKATGGREFDPEDLIQLRNAYDTIQEELRNQYNLGYVPPKTGGSDFRRIKLRTNKGKYDIITRAGYYPKQ